VGAAGFGCRVLAGGRCELGAQRGAAAPLSLSQSQESLCGAWRPLTPPPPAAARLHGLRGRGEGHRHRADLQLRQDRVQQGQRIRAGGGGGGRRLQLGPGQAAGWAQRARRSPAHAGGFPRPRVARPCLVELLPCSTAWARSQAEGGGWAGPARIQPPPRPALRRPPAAAPQVAISTRDVYKTAEQIRAAGGNITREPGPVPGIGTKITACTDPDGGCGRGDAAQGEAGAGGGCIAGGLGAGRHAACAGPSAHGPWAGLGGGGATAAAAAAAAARAPASVVLLPESYCRIRLTAAVPHSAPSHPLHRLEVRVCGRGGLSEGAAAVRRLGGWNLGSVCAGIWEDGPRDCEQASKRVAVVPMATLQDRQRSFAGSMARAWGGR
jgi:hypothetical protein